MDTSQKYARLLLVGLIGSLLAAAPSLAQVRTKKPDRGVYESPTLTPVVVDSIEVSSSKTIDAEAQIARNPRPLFEVGLEDLNQSHDSAPRKRQPARSAERRDFSQKPKLQQVGHEEVILTQPGTPPSAPPLISEGTILPGGDYLTEPPTPWVENEVYDQGHILHDTTCDGCSDCGFDACDSMGCDSMGSNAPWYRSWANGAISLDSSQWFGSVELLLMFRRGDRLPTLVTTGPPIDSDTAGEIGDPGTSVLVGGDSILKDLTAGGRLTLGTWLDHSRSRSLVFRGWFAGEETFDFNQNQDQTPVLVRPFLNVSDNQVAAQDTQVIAFPGRSSGNISVQASSEIFGGDISVRQLWYEKYGARVDVLYGYQYTRVAEDLRIASSSTSLDDDFAPIDSVISVEDNFDTENDFHGGQFGFAGSYREGCWSFNSLIKVGFGSLRRRANLSGSTTTTIDAATAVDPNGLLVRSTNAGQATDHTFGWVPELDFSLGWHRYRNFDITVGYHVIAVTDAIQVSNTIDPALRVNLSDPPIGEQRPFIGLSFDTYYVQGIHFGLQYVH